MVTIDSIFLLHLCMYAHIMYVPCELTIIIFNFCFESLIQTKIELPMLLKTSALQ